MGSKRIGLARTEALLENLKRDLNMNGSHIKAATGWTSTLVTLNAATATLTQAQDGATVELHRAAGIVVTLPSAVIGTKYNFIVRTECTSNDLQFNCASGDSFSTTSYICQKDRSSAGVENVLKRATSGNTRLNAPGHGTNKTAMVGTWFKLVCVAANTWHVEGHAYVDATGAWAFSTP
jgi:hypothetical protein